MRSASHSLSDHDSGVTHSTAMAIEFPSTLSAAKQQFITDFYQTSDEPESVDKVRRLGVVPARFQS